MALNQNAVAAAIKAAKESVLGPPSDQALADQVYQAEAAAIIAVLTGHASVQMNGGGLDSNGDTLADNNGVIS